jgi:hypothetical protein
LEFSREKNPLILALCLPAPMTLFLLALRLRLSTGTYPYYFHKASLFIVSSTMIAILLVVLDRVDKSFLETTDNKGVQGIKVVGWVAAGLSLSQVFGYWGFDYPTFSAGNSAIGVLSRNEVTRSEQPNRPTADIIIREAAKVQELPLEMRSCLTLIIPARVGILSGTAANPWKDTLSNVWFHALTSSYTIAAREQAYMTPNVAPALGNEAELVEAISKTFDPPSVCIFSTPYVTTHLNELGNDWTTRDFSSS